MARRRRGFEQFSMSFLDAMSCGLGAVILIFMVINHASERRATDMSREVSVNLSQLESEVLEKREASRKLSAALKESEAKLRTAEAEMASLKEIIEQEDDSDQEVQVTEENIRALKDELKALEKQVETLREEQGEGDATRRFEGEGNRQYLTGLKVDGRHVVILLDRSASMLGDTIIDVIRRRNMSEQRQRRSPKWQRALNTVDWITTQIRPDAEFQIYGFNTRLQPALSGSEGKWLPAKGADKLNEAVTATREWLPENGTSLERAFASLGELSPRPDSVFLITDGLPTQDFSGGQKGGVSGKRRLDLYTRAVRRLPKDVPVNIILFPMEGDPMAASTYWQLAQVTGGTFMSPSRDWP